MDTPQQVSIDDQLQWIRRRAARFGIQGHDLEDVVQEIAAYLLSFRPDMSEANGASELTVLIGAIDLRVKQWLRARRRYLDLIERHGELRSLAGPRVVDDAQAESGISLDVASLMSQLPEFAQRVARLLAAGRTATSIARTLGVERRTVLAAIDLLRTRFQAFRPEGKVEP